MSKNNLAYLRIAVLWNDSLTSEQLIDSRKPAFVGANRNNDLMVPDAGGLGDRYELFTPAPGGFSVNIAGLSDSLSGRLHLGGQETTVEEARRTLVGLPRTPNRRASWTGATFCTPGDPYGLAECDPIHPNALGSG